MSRQALFSDCIHLNSSLQIPVLSNSVTERDFVGTVPIGVALFIFEICINTTFKPALSDHVY